MKKKKNSFSCYHHCYETDLHFFFLQIIQTILFFSLSSSVKFSPYKQPGLSSVIFLLENTNSRTRTERRIPFEWVISPKEIQSICINSNYLRNHTVESSPKKLMTPRGVDEIRSVSINLIITNRLARFIRKSSHPPPDQTTCYYPKQHLSRANEWKRVKKPTTSIFLVTRNSFRKS